MVKYSLYDLLEDKNINGYCEDFEIGRNIKIYEIDLWQELIKIPETYSYLEKILNQEPYRNLKEVENTLEKEEVNEIKEDLTSKLSKYKSINLENLSIESNYEIINFCYQNFENYALINALENLTLPKEKQSTIEKLYISLTNERNKLVENHSKLVHQLARIYCYDKDNLKDLLQAGNIGLITAANRYDYERGYKFSTYASWWIKKEIFECISYSRTIKVPQHKFDLYKEIRDINKEYLERTHEKATFEEIAEKLNFPVKKIEECVISFGFIKSLDKKISDSENDDKTLKDTLVDEKSNTVNDVQNEQFNEIIMNSINNSTLTPKELNIIKMRYGLEGNEEMTLQGIGNKYGVTRERIRQLIQKAFEKLRNDRTLRKLNRFSEI